MARDLIRTPLKTVVVEGLREPHKADRLTNRVRRMRDKFSDRRLHRPGDNRRARSLYKRRLPQNLDHRHHTNAANAAKGPKRTAPEKRIGGVRLRQR